MMQNPLRKLKEFFTPRPLQRGGRRMLFAAVFLAMFLFGYNMTGSVYQKCNAQMVIGGPCVTPFCIPAIPCDIIGSTSLIKEMLIESLEMALMMSATTLEAFLTVTIDGLVAGILTRLDEMEQDMMKWWDTFWYYNMKPGMQAMTRQLNVALTEQARGLHSSTDASDQNDLSATTQKRENENHRLFRPSENVCVAGSNVGGAGRATTIARAIRKAWEREAQEPGLNKQGSVGATAAIAAERRRYDEYKTIFCDPNANGGKNFCTGAPQYYNADVQPTKFIYNKMTIDVDTDTRLAKTVETINNNLVGVPSADPISRGALASSSGQEAFLDRRAYLARYAAVRTVPQLITGWRIPGSRARDQVRALRDAAGVSVSSDNPSYKEVMHAITVDRFNSGKYAIQNITNPSAVELEKLTLNALYLTQLRDYYELLERTALTLAVQVSLMAEQEGLPDTGSVTPLK